MKKVNSRGIPVPAAIVSASITAVCVVVNYLIPGQAFQLFYDVGCGCACY
ncbi:hypothetical protein ABVN80_10255 [Acinetobacter baumannii]